MNVEEILRHHHFDVSSLSLPEYQRGGDEHLIYFLHVPITQALSQWEVLRNLVPETGYWPVIGWDRFKKPPWEDDVVQDILEEGLYIDVQKWLKQGESQTRIDENREKRHANDQYSSFVFRLHLQRFPYTLDTMPRVICTALSITETAFGSGSFTKA